MINKGNPYHAEDGKFTSKDEQGSGSSAPESKKSSDPLMDLYRSLMESLNGGSKKVENTRKKYYPSTLDGEILDEEGIEAESEEEAMKIAAEKFPGRGDELMVFADDEDESKPNYEDSKEEAMKMFDLDGNSKKSDYDFYNDLYNDELYDSFNDLGLDIRTASDFHEGGDSSFLVFGKDNNSDYQSVINDKLNEIAKKYGISFKMREIEGWNDGPTSVKAYKIKFSREPQEEVSQEKAEEPRKKSGLLDFVKKNK